MSNAIQAQAERYMDLLAERQRLVASNLANIDTPGYRTVGFDFAGEMSRSLDGLRGTAGAPVADAPVHPVRIDGLLERPDGNNVSMDREGMKMAEAQLQFQTGVELLKHAFSRVENTIRMDEK